MRGKKRRKKKLTKVLLKFDWHFVVHCKSHWTLTKNRSILCCPAHSDQSTRRYTAGATLQHQRLQQSFLTTSLIKAPKLAVWMRPTHRAPKKKNTTHTNPARNKSLNVMTGVVEWIYKLPYPASSARLRVLTDNKSGTKLHNSTGVIKPLLYHLQVLSWIYTSRMRTKLLTSNKCFTIKTNRNIEVWSH